MNFRKYLFILIPYSWLVALFLVPFIIVVKMSLSDGVMAIPPYTPYLTLTEGWAGITNFFTNLDFENFIFLTEDNNSILKSVHLTPNGNWLRLENFNP